MVEARGRSPSVGSQKTRAGCSVHGLNLHSCSDVTPPSACYTATLRVGDRAAYFPRSLSSWPGGRDGTMSLVRRDANGRPALFSHQFRSHALSLPLSVTARGPARFPSTIAIHSRPHYPYPHTFRSVVRAQRSASNIRCPQHRPHTPSPQLRNSRRAGTALASINELRLRVAAARRRSSHERELPRCR